MRNDASLCLHHQFFHASQCLHGRGVYCSLKCKGIASQKGNRKCVVCGKMFLAWGNPKKTGICCSRKCGFEHHKTGQNITCEVCGKVAWKHQCEMNHKHHFCSLNCGNYFQKTTTDKQRMRQSGINSCLSQSSRRGLNGLEMAGRKILEEMGYILKADFLEQAVLCGNVVDVYFPKQKVIIQWDGDYWHGNPSVRKTITAYQKKQADRDIRQDKHFSENGFRILRIWEFDIKKHRDSVIRKIGAFLQSELAL